jgi:hypothetical protein
MADDTSWLPDFVFLPDGMAAGDLIYWNGSALARLPVGNADDVLTVVGGVPAWVSTVPPVFDPATLSLTGWWRASYAGSPWTPTASAGSSGSNGNLAHATNAPDVGAAVNGFTPADFIPANTDRLDNASGNINTFVSSAAGSIWCLFYADAAFTDLGSAQYYQNPSFLVNATDGYLGFGFSTSGVRLGSYSGSSFDSVAAACATGGWHLAQARWNTTTKEVRVDGGSWQTLAHAVSIGSLTSGFRVGCNYVVSQLFDGRILDLGTAQSRLSDTNFDDIRSYCNSRYGVAV